MEKIIAAGPIIIENRKVLLVMDGQDDFWKFCGGKKEEFDKNPEEVSRRESLEELGIEVEILNPIPYVHEEGRYLLYHYLSKRLNNIKGGSARKWRWVPLRSLNRYNNLANNVIPALQHFNFLK